MSLPPAEPIFFGAPLRPLFGWLHLPVPGRAAAVGMVICNPFGYEAVCTHRTLRRCAEMAAHAGIASLRFDYEGTGDSSGSDISADRLASWIADIGAAIDSLRRHSGVGEVSLLGLRLGAALATLAAQRRSDVTTLIAVAPVVSGRRYSRELRALQMSGQPHQPPPDAPAEADLQIVAGFPVAGTTRADLMKVDLSRLDPLSVRAALLLQRDDLPLDPALGLHFQSLGIQVTEQRFSGYVAMMLDAHETQIPEDMLSSAINWLAQQDAAGGAHIAADAPIPLREADRRTRFIEPGAGGPRSIAESAMFLAESLRLFAIVSEPVMIDAADSAARKVILLLNAGAVHHIGPNRLYVRFARQCAAQGATVVRMDLSGIGDTPPRADTPANIVYAPYLHDDIALAIASLAARFDTHDIHCVGMCSGAYYALKAAMRGQPLRSVTIINPLTYALEEPALEDQPQHRVSSEASRYRRVALRLSSWRKLLRGEVQVRAALGILANRALHLGDSAYRNARRTLGIPVRDDLGAQIRAVAAQDIRLRFIFSASDPGHAMLQEQAGGEVRQLQRRRLLTIDMIDGADHTFTSRCSQQALLQLLSTQFGYAPDALADAIVHH